MIAVLHILYFEYFGLHELVGENYHSFGLLLSMIVLLHDGSMSTPLVVALVAPGCNIYKEEVLS